VAVIFFEIQDNKKLALTEIQKIIDQEKLLKIAKYGENLNERLTAIETLIDKETLYEIANGGSEYIFTWKEENFDNIGYLGGLAGLSSDEIDDIEPYYITKTFDLRETARERLKMLKM